MSTTTTRERPLATVVIPTYNDVEHLLAALELIRAQTWPHVEIIVADDGSATPVEPLVRAWAGCDARVSVVRRPANGGVAAAQQLGLDRARGEFIYLASTNDPIEPRFLEASIGALERHPRAGLCFSDAGIIAGWSDTRHAFPLGLARSETGFEPDRLAALLRRRPFHISSNTVVYRTRSIRAVGGCRPDLGLYADWFTSMVVALREGAAYVPEVFAYSRAHASAYSDRARWNRAKLAAAVVEAIVAEQPDILARLRHSAVLSDFGPLVLIALQRDKRTRPLVGFEALWVALLRAGWRRMLPRRSRRLLRQAVMPEAA
ncbi:MAG TPA: glycosyltransferase [Xanthobacteraceae bacterium]|nr:glycosyltransferase [Xanthobacteraceae bacterium]